MNLEQFKQENIIIIYHAHCLDGFGAAYAVRECLGEGPNIEYYAGSYQGEIPKVKDKHVICVDFSYKPEAALKMLEDGAESVLILDHHKSAMLQFEKYPNEIIEALDNDTTVENWLDVVCFVSNFKKIYHLFNINHSGAVIAWKFFNPDKKSPTLISYIEDRDLWKFCIGMTKEVTAALYSYEMDFKVWDNLFKVKPLSDLINEGMALMRSQRKNVEMLVKYNTRMIDICGRKVPSVNCPPMFASDVGNELAKNAPFSATWYDQSNARNYSLRSSADNPEHVDVSEIAQQFGGGGHKHAAGFKLPLNDSYSPLTPHDLTGE